MPPLGNPNGATLVSYNGVTLSSSAMYTTRVTARPVLTDGERSVRFVEYTLYFEGPVFVSPPDGTTADASLANLRKKLEATGGALAYVAKGFGPLYANFPGQTPWDVKWGPEPQVLEFRPLGGDGQAAWLRWSVVCRLPECPDSTTYKLGVLAFEYAVDWAIDRDGLTTYTTTGYLEIPMSKKSVNDRSIPDSADRLREKVIGDPPFGFRRESQHYKLSLDRRRLDFTVVDKEMPVAGMPTGLSYASVRHRVASRIDDGFALWDVSLTGTLTMTMGQRRQDVYTKWIMIVFSRMQKAAKQLGLAVANRPQPGQFGALVLDWSVEEDVFGLDTSFATHARYLGVDIRELLQWGRLWTPIDGTDYTSWKQSLANSSFNVRGWAGLKFDPNGEAIVDLCTTKEPTVLKPGGGKTPGGGIQNNPTPPSPGNRPDVDPVRNWVFYRVWFTLEEYTEAVAHKPLRRTVPAAVGGTSPGLTGGNYNFGGGSSPGLTGGVFDFSNSPPAVQGGGQLSLTKDQQPSLAGGPAALTSVRPQLGDPQNDMQGDPADIIQRPVAPTYFVTLHVAALRAGYEIPMPRLVSFGGAAVQVVADRRRAGEHARVDGIPVFFLFGQTTYRLLTAPKGEMPVIGNPSFDQAG